MTDRKERIRALNDNLRRLHRGGRVPITPGIQALDERTIRRIDVAIADFAAFDNDPQGEHDFGRVEVDGETVVWKIDCYDRNLEGASEDAADPAVTRRVLTIMLSDEY